MVASRSCGLTGVLKRMRILIWRVRQRPSVRACAFVEQAAAESVATGVPRTLIRGEISNTGSAGSRASSKRAMTNAERCSTVKRGSRGSLRGLIQTLRVEIAILNNPSSIRTDDVECWRRRSVRPRICR